MKEIRGQASEVVGASLDDCLALVAAVDGYPVWCPDIVRNVHVLDRGADGRPDRARMTMHVARGPFVKEFDLFLAIVVEPPGTVRLTRVADRPSDQEFNATWTLVSAQSTRIALSLDAKFQVPRYVPTGGAGDAIAREFVAAARRALAAPD